VINKIELAGLIGGLPKGLETVVGERGVKLSGGERQRLAFGRIMLQDPRIVIMDEPTSALDSLTEDHVTREMARFLKGKTVIIVAHRLQSVKQADQIIVLDQGRIVQRGCFEGLVSEPGIFHDLWEKQTEEKILEQTLDS
jgi:ABC-type multidrug transport system fused ATPase/permease subunit